MVNITDVRQILQFAIDAEIKVFLDGGWRSEEHTLNSSHPK